MVGYNNQEKSASSASSASKKLIMTHPRFFIMKGPLHTAHHSDARSDGGKDGDERLNHQFPNLSFFHDFLIFDF